MFIFNKTALESIVDCLVYCGKQGIALGGDRDDSTANETVKHGIFKALLQMYATKDLKNLSTPALPIFSILLKLFKTI